jgi:formylglycine-generating enzyme required for sulfatase activity
MVIDDQQEPPVNWLRWAERFRQLGIVRHGDPPQLASLKEVWPMVRQVSTVALVLLAALGSLTLATAQEPQQPGGKKQIAVDLGGGVKMELVLIPAGEFQMGSGESAEATAAFFKKNYGKDLVQADWFKDEHPQHRVRITKPFYLGTCHVTRGQFRQFVAATAYKTDAEKAERPGAVGWDADKKAFGFKEKYSWRNAGFEQTDEHPVVNVSWNDAVAFCKWLSKKENKTCRLPTEAEWEYACRAGTTTRYSSGDDPETLAKVGNVADATAKAKFPRWRYTIKANDGYVFTAPVGKFKPNAFGLYDMHGNAWQWCADWYGAEYYAKSAADDPTGPDTGVNRVLRGGSWDDRPYGARSAIRLRIGPGSRDFVAGFRVARTQ